MLSCTFKMKFALLAIAPLVLCSHGMKAQSSSGKFRIGLITSLEKNLSSEDVAFDEYTGYSAEYDKINYRIGINLEYAVIENLTINTAVNYSNKDFTGTYYCAVCDFFLIPTPEKINFRFIEIPITAKYYFLPKKIRLFGEAGINNLISLNNEVIENSYSLGIRLGGGIEYNATPKLAFQVSSDYNLGMTKMSKESGYKINSLAVGIGVARRL